MKVNRESLLSTLSAVKLGLASKEIMEQTKSFAFRNGRVWAYNDSLYTSAPSPVEDVEGAVPAEELQGLLAKMKDEEVDVTASGNEMLVAGRRTKAGIRLETEIKLPLAALDKKMKWQSVCADLLEGMCIVWPFATKSLSRPELACVHIGGGNVEATDNFQIARSPAKTGKEPVLVPAHHVPDVLAIGPVCMADRSEWLAFRNEGEVEVGVRLVEGEYPDLSPFLKPSKGMESVEFPAGLLETIERAEVFATAEFLQDERLDITFKDGHLKVRAKSDRGWIEETVRTRFKGAMQFAVGPSLLRMVLDRSNTVTVGDGRMLVCHGKAQFSVSLFTEEEP